MIESATPLAKATVAASAQAASMTQRTKEAPPVRVLCVEDNPVCAMVMAEFFALQPGWKAEVAVTGTEALARAAQSRPDLILLDLFLPDLDGLEVLALLRNDPHLLGVPVVIVTGSIHEDDQRQALAAGAAAVWHKPLNRSGFFEQLQGVLAA